MSEDDDQTDAIETKSKKMPVYKETTAGLTSASQLVDTTEWIKLVSDSTDYIKLISYSTVVEH